MESIIHFLNVCDGDCSLIQHSSGRNTVIDICNARKIATYTESLESKSDGVRGNFKQKEYPVNPINYFKSFNIDSIFRFILTHPDMDHLDGIKDLFESFTVINFWDTKNNKVIKKGEFGKYREEDWNYYQELRKGGCGIKVLNNMEGDSDKYYNDGPDGDSLTILSPNSELIDEANKNGNYNNCSYIILHKVNGRKILFCGDSEKKAWDIIMEKYSESLKDIDILIAPHHGRKSGGNENYLDILNPKLTLFGNAKSEHLDYNSWNNRKLEHITNNQANCIVIKIQNTGEINVYCTYENFARAYTREKGIETFYEPALQAWYLLKI